MKEKKIIKLKLSQILSLIDTWINFNPYNAENALQINLVHKVKINI